MEWPVLIVRTLIYPTAKSAALLSNTLPLWLSGALCGCVRSEGSAILFLWDSEGLQRRLCPQGCAKCNPPSGTVQLGIRDGIWSFKSVNIAIDHENTHKPCSEEWNKSNLENPLIYKRVGLLLADLWSLPAMFLQAYDSAARLWRWSPGLRQDSH